MPGLEIWVVYNKFNQNIDVVKSKRSAVRIGSTYNKLFRLINSDESVICMKAEEFFSSHHYDKQNIRFCWKINNIVEKSELMRIFYNYKHKKD